MTLFMLDTNAASQAIRAHPGVIARLTSKPLSEVCISAITRGELLSGVAKRPQASRLARAVSEFLLRVEAQPWTSEVADRYAVLRAGQESRGLSLAPLDLLIAAHALAASATLVTNDRAFAHVPDLTVEDWQVP
jgi:tRNA(fMet)-specific endonuclease VapC